MPRRAWLYPALVILSVTVIAAVLYLGNRTLTPAQGALIPHPEAAISRPWDLWRHNASQPLSRLIIQILVVIGAARLFGALVHRVRQPSVIGEIVAGIALGPSFLGAVFPGLSAALFPPSSLGVLQMLSQIGVILFMFVVGLELHWSHVRRQAHVAVAISHVSIMVPFLLGVLAAFPLFRDHAPPGVAFEAFGLFMGIAMSITAFPVLARILDERGLTKTPLGATALTCAAVDDVTAWTLLTFVVAVVTSGGALASLAATLTAAVALTLFMAFVVRPRLARLDIEGPHAFSRDRMAIVAGVLFASAFMTELIGVHALFGAFLAGAIMPTSEHFRAGLRDRIEGFSTVFLLPLFFAYTGLRTEVGLLDDASAWLACLGIIALATLGKLGASAVTARIVGMRWDRAFAIGALMNTRGLMELIALNIGYDLGVISREMFAILVLMALVTTAMTAPLLDAALRRSPSVATL